MPPDLPARLARKWCPAHYDACECSRLEGAVREALEEVEKLIQTWAAQYPEDIFRPVAGDVNPSPDRIAASMARHLCKEIGNDIAALRGGTP